MWDTLGSDREAGFCYLPCCCCCRPAARPPTWLDGTHECERSEEEKIYISFCAIWKISPADPFPLSAWLRGTPARNIHLIWNGRKERERNGWFPAPFFALQHESDLSSFGVTIAKQLPLLNPTPKEWVTSQGQVSLYLLAMGGVVFICFRFAFICVYAINTC